MPKAGRSRRVIDTQGMEAVFESLSQITADIQQVTAALRDVLGGERGAGSLQRIVENLIHLSESVDNTVRTSGEKLNAILANFEGVSADVRGLTAENEAEVTRIVNNIEIITKDVREVLATREARGGHQRGRSEGGRRQPEGHASRSWTGRWATWSRSPPTVRERRGHGGRAAHRRAAGPEAQRDASRT